MDDLRGSDEYKEILQYREAELINIVQGIPHGSLRAFVNLTERGKTLLNRKAAAYNVWMAETADDLEQLLRRHDTSLSRVSSQDLRQQHDAFFNTAIMEIEAGALSTYMPNPNEIEDRHLYDRFTALQKHAGIVAKASDDLDALMAGVSSPLKGHDR